MSESRETGFLSQSSWQVLCFGLSPTIRDSLYATAVCHFQKPSCFSVVSLLVWVHIVNSSVWYANRRYISCWICDLWFSQLFETSLFPTTRDPTASPSLSVAVFLWPHSSKGWELCHCNFNLVSLLAEQLCTGFLPDRISIPFKRYLCITHNAVLIHCPVLCA